MLKILQDEIDRRIESKKQKLSQLDKDSDQQNDYTVVVKELRDIKSLMKKQSKILEESGQKTQSENIPSHG